MLENKYQAYLIELFEEIFPGCIVLKNDTGFRQGIPDLTILHHAWWAILEVKKSENETPRPNQPWYIAKADDMSFGAFIYPENEEEVIDALQRSFQRSLQSRRSARFSQR